MGRRALELLPLLLWLASAGHAGSLVDIEIGLAGEYIGEAQEIGIDRSEYSSLRTSVWLALGGHVIDPRFLSYDLAIRKSLLDLDRMDAGTTESDDLTYYGRIQAFSNRAVSFQLGAQRSDTDVSGVTGGAWVGGVNEDHYAQLDFRPSSWPDLRLVYRVTSFEPNTPESLRGSETTRTRFHLTHGWDGFSFRLGGGLTEHELYSGRLRQEREDLIGELVFTPKPLHQLRANAFATGYRQAFDDDPYGDRTTNLLFGGSYQIMFKGGGFTSLSTRHQRVEAGGQEVSSDQATFSLVRQLSEQFSADGSLRYYRSEDNQQEPLEQPSASLGATWGSNRERWRFSLRPQLLYLQVRRADVSESSFGTSLSGWITRSTKRGSLDLNFFWRENQFSLVPVGPDDEAGGSHFLAGTEREAQQAQLRWRIGFARRSSASLGAFAQRNVRVFRGEDVETTLYRGHLAVFLGPFSLSASTTQTEVQGGDIPSRTTYTEATMFWTPAWWLVFDTRYLEEEREALGTIGTFQAAEAGVRLRYAKLSFYARYRRDLNGDGFDERYDERVWIGIERTFDLRLGSGNRR